MAVRSASKRRANSITPDAGELAGGTASVTVAAQFAVTRPRMGTVGRAAAGGTPARIGPRRLPLGAERWRRENIGTQHDELRRRRGAADRTPRARRPMPVTTARGKCGSEARSTVPRLSCRRAVSTHVGEWPPRNPRTAALDSASGRREHPCVRPARLRSAARPALESREGLAARGDGVFHVEHSPFRALHWTPRHRARVSRPPPTGHVRPRKRGARSTPGRAADRVRTASEAAPPLRRWPRGWQRGRPGSRERRARAALERSTRNTLAPTPPDAPRALDCCGPR